MIALPRYFLRVAVMSTLVALVVMLALSWLINLVTDSIFEASLTAAQRAELNSMADTLSPELAAAISRYYGSPWQYLTMAASFLAGIAAGGWVGMRHARPLLQALEAVAAAARRLAGGETTVRAEAPPTGIREVDDFAHDFNAMAGSIGQFEQNLRSANAAIAHELRTPLTVLTGRINGMIDGIFAADPDGLRLLLTQTEQLNRIVGDLRLMTLAQAGQIAMSPEIVDLADIVAALVPRDRRPPCELALTPAPALADPQRVGQILAALLDNADRYAGQGLRVETGQNDGAEAWLSVADRGPGLTPAQAERAFDLFWRADVSRNREAGGSGLGLSVVRSLAQAQGGSVRYDDRAGGGAVFTVTFPTP